MLRSVDRVRFKDTVVVSQPEGQSGNDSSGLFYRKNGKCVF